MPLNDNSYKSAKLNVCIVDDNAQWYTTISKDSMHSHYMTRHSNFFFRNHFIFNHISSICAPLLLLFFVHTAERNVFQAFAVLFHLQCLDPRWMKQILAQFVVDFDEVRIMFAPECIIPCRNLQLNLWKHVRHSHRDTSCFPINLCTASDRHSPHVIEHSKTMFPVPEFDAFSTVFHICVGLYNSLISIISNPSIEWKKTKTKKCCNQFSFSLSFFILILLCLFFSIIFVYVRAVLNRCGNVLILNKPTHRMQNFAWTWCFFLWLLLFHQFRTSSTNFRLQMQHIFLLNKHEKKTARIQNSSMPFFDDRIEVKSKFMSHKR